MSACQHGYELPGNCYKCGERRDRFAAAALAGLIAGDIITVDMGKLARDAARLADALILALEKKEEGK